MTIPCELAEACEVTFRAEAPVLDSGANTCIGFAGCAIFARLACDFALAASIRVSSGGGETLTGDRGRPLGCESRGELEGVG